ncbi:MAG TPA: glycosyltransferase family 2 protein [Candidatus Merdenecus merdavium]|nr:glycosyltransferase family 2 protein [Candidatus Merdenecus merdavium]
MENMKVDVVIPTYKPDAKLKNMVELLRNQSLPVQKILIINTEEEYFPKGIFEPMSEVEIIHIKKSEYDHGATRDMGAKKCHGDIVVFMTQDAMPKDDTLIAHLIEPLKDKRTACSYGKQLPLPDCEIIERYTRSFNYGDEDLLKTKASISHMGIKTFFCSNVCAAYRKDVYEELGGFVHQAIFNEDMIYAGRAILAGYQVAYASKARVYHSHNYNHRQQFQRNFDLGVSQADYPDVFSAVKSESEGVKLVKETGKYLIRIKKPWLILDLVIKSGVKFLGFQFGKSYKKLPSKIILWCTMSPSYWDRKKSYQ